MRRSWRVCSANGCYVLVRTQSLLACCPTPFLSLMIVVFRFVRVALITRFAGADPDGDDTHVRDLALEVVGVGISSPRPLLPHPADPPLGDVSSSAHGRGIAVRLVSDGSRSGRSREDGAADSDTAVSAATAPSQQSRHHTLRFSNVPVHKRRC